MLRRFGGLWTDRDFLKLYASSSISGIGSQVSLLALPLLAVIVLHATATEMGLLRAAATLPNLAFGLFVGVLVDRQLKRRLMIVANLLAGLVMAIVPAAAVVHQLGLPLLYAVAFLSGTTTLVIAVAVNAYLPLLVGRQRIMEANGKFSIAYSTINILGPNIGGTLVQLVSAPYAILADAVSFLLCALILVDIRRPEPPSGQSPRAKLFEQVVEGLRHVTGSPVLRPLLMMNVSFNFFSVWIQSIFLLFAVRELDLSPAAIGLVYGAAGPGALVGSIAGARLGRRFGAGPAMVALGLAACAGWMLAPAAFGPPGVRVAILALSQFTLYAGAIGTNVNLVSLRQAVTPDHLLGRVSATFTFVVHGVPPLGAILGGLLGALLGTRSAIVLGAVGMLIAVAFLVASPIRRANLPSAAAAE